MEAIIYFARGWWVDRAQPLPCRLFYFCTFVLKYRRTSSITGKAALWTPLRGTQKKSIARYEPPFTKDLRSAGSRASPTKSIHQLWRPRWPTLRNTSLVEGTNIANDEIMSFNLRYTRFPHSIDRSSLTIYMTTTITNKGRHFSYQKSGAPSKSRTPNTTRTMIWSVMKLGKVILCKGPPIIPTQCRTLGHVYYTYTLPRSHRID